MKLFPFDPAKAQTITNPDGFPVYWSDGQAAKNVCVFPSGFVAIEWPHGTASTHTADSAREFLRLGPKPGKTVYLNCWVEGRTSCWAEFVSEYEARAYAEATSMPHKYIAIPVTGPEIEP